VTQPREPSIWELSEQIRAMDRNHREGLAEIKATLAALDRVYLRSDVYQARHQALRDEVATVAARLAEVDARHGDEIGEMRSGYRWVSRAAITGLLLPVLATIIAAIALSGGLR
jgi:hypothetical protein